jgi:threonine synthase
MSLVASLRCPRCGFAHENFDAVRCPKCQSALLFDYDYEKVKQVFTSGEFKARTPGVWKYSEILPITNESDIVSLGEGGTFMHDCPRLAREVGIRKLLLKDETTNPTGSFVDRGMTVEASKAKELRSRIITCGAKGNLGASAAAYAAKAGARCKLLLPEILDTGKLYQMIAYGAEIEPVRDYEGALRRTRQSLNEYVVSPASPFFLEGEKTTGLEICEQLDWALPDRIVVPVGNGGHLAMIWKALNDLRKAKLIGDESVRMTCVQPQGAAPIVHAFNANKTDVAPMVSVKTFVPDIVVPAPLHGFMALKALSESKGSAISVADREILKAASLLAHTEGIFAEPAAAAAIAGLAKAVRSDKIDRDEEVVCVVTGAGLKDPNAVKQHIDRSKMLDRLLRRAEPREFTLEVGGTKLSILQLLGDSPTHGYGIWKALADEFGISVKLPSVYQHLTELEGLNLISRVRPRVSMSKREIFQYQLTEKGREVLRARRQIE